LKIAVISDMHLGAKWGTPRENDSFEQAKEAIERAIELGAQAFIFPGDIFDARIPRQEVWAKAMRVLSIPAAHVNGGVRLVGGLGKDLFRISPLASRGLPVLALHGNHERRTRGLTNPVEALEAAGLLVHLDCGTVILDDGGDRVAVHGMSNVPEQHAKNSLAAWNPRPVENAKNILVLHQSVGQFVYSGEEKSTLDTPDLPPEFDIYICGHIHYRCETTAHSKPLLFPGSTERTQLLRIEAEVRKGFYMLDIGERIGYEFHELSTPREFYYEEMRFEGADAREIELTLRRKIEELISRQRKNQKIPLIRVRLLGTLSKSSTRSDIDDQGISEEFSNRAIVYVSKGDLVSPGVEEKIQLLRDLKEKRLTLDETTMAVLDENLKELGYTGFFDVRTLYELLGEDREEEALRHIYDVVGRLVTAEMGEQCDNKG